MPPMPCRPTMRPRRAGRPGVLLSYRIHPLADRNEDRTMARSRSGWRIGCRMLAPYRRSRRSRRHRLSQARFRSNATTAIESEDAATLPRFGRVAEEVDRAVLHAAVPYRAAQHASASCARPTDADRAGNQAATDCAGQPLMRCEAELRLPGAHKARAWAVPTRRSRYGLGSANQGRIETSGSRARRVAMSAARSPLRTPLSPGRTARRRAPAPRRRRPARRRA